MKKKIRSKMLFTLISIIFFLLHNAVTLAAEDKFYNLELNYNNGLIALKSVTALPGSMSTGIQTGTGYAAELVNFRGEVLHKTIFEIPLTIIVDIIDAETGEFSGETIQLNETDFSLRIPYFPNGEQINIYDSANVKMLEIPVLQFADTCGDKICDPQESYESCSQDCPSGSADDYCDAVGDNICDIDCKSQEDRDCKVEQTNYFRYIVSIIFIGLIIILSIKFTKSLKHTHETLSGAK